MQINNGLYLDCWNENDPSSAVPVFGYAAFSLYGVCMKLTPQELKAAQHQKARDSMYDKKFDQLLKLIGSGNDLAH